MQAHAAVLKAHQVRESLQEELQLRELVRSLSQEIERLSEDNAQLNAAVKIYREVVRRYAAHEGALSSTKHPRTASARPH